MQEIDDALKMLYGDNFEIPGYARINQREYFILGALLALFKSQSALSGLIADGRLPVSISNLVIEDNGTPQVVAPSTVEPVVYVEPQLSAPGSTEPRSFKKFKNLSCIYKVLSINTSVTVQVEGRLSADTDWVDIALEEEPVTRTENGIYHFFAANRTYEDIRFNFLVEAGGEDATIDVVLRFGA